MPAAVTGMEDGTYSSCSLSVLEFICMPTEGLCGCEIPIRSGLRCSLYCLCCGSKLQRPGAEACRQHELMNEQNSLLIFGLLLF